MRRATRKEIRRCLERRRRWHAKRAEQFEAVARRRGVAGAADCRVYVAEQRAAAAVLLDVVRLLDGKADAEDRSYREPRRDPGSASGAVRGQS